jgi:RHS repeat-associated protein
LQNIIYPTFTKEFIYDDDGNLTGRSEGVSYVYNAENRLIEVSPDTPIEGDKRVTFLYDYMGRRVQKSVYAYISGAWQLDKEILFVYDGWNLIKETITPAGQAAMDKYYVWGLDLSNSLQDAGGVGGLLATIDNGKAYYYCYDANGNVGQMIDSSDGTVAAHYQYYPFGELRRAEGVYWEENWFRFSTKYFDTETNLYYYGYRYYESVMGRWLNRDPIEEIGGINLYAYIMNATPNRIDPLGLLEAACCDFTKCKKCHFMEEVIIDSTGEILYWNYRWDWNARLEIAMKESTYQILRVTLNVIDKSKNPADLNPTYFVDNFDLIRPFLPDNGRITFEGQIGIRWPVEKFAEFNVISEVCDDYMMLPVEVSRIKIGPEFEQEVVEKAEPYIISHPYN